MVSEIKNYFPQLRSLFKKHHVQNAYLFGSAAKENMHSQSDYDFLVSFVPELDYETYANNYFDLLYSLQNLLNAEVDIVAEETLSNPYLIESIHNNKLSIL